MVVAQSRDEEQITAMMDNLNMTYLLTIVAKRFSFASPTVVISVTDELTGIDFVAEALQ